MWSTSGQFHRNLQSSSLNVYGWKNINIESFFKQAFTFWCCQKLIFTIYYYACWLGGVILLFGWNICLMSVICIWLLTNQCITIPHHVQNTATAPCHGGSGRFPPFILSLKRIYNNSKALLWCFNKRLRKSRKRKKENWQLKREKTNIKKKDLYSELLKVRNTYEKGKTQKAVTKVDKR